MESLCTREPRDSNSSVSGTTRYVDVIGIDLTQACRTKSPQVLIPYQVTGSDSLEDNVL